jgi:hypothetical protein
MTINIANRIESNLHVAMNVQDADLIVSDGKDFYGGWVDVAPGTDKIMKIKSNAGYSQAYYANPSATVVISNEDEPTVVQVYMHNPRVGHNVYKVSVYGCNKDKYKVTRSGSGGGDDSWVGYTIERSGIPKFSTPWWSVHLSGLIILS